ncbi:EF-hand calcium-binding domain-containing protein 3-like [Trichomycterus rosablanca]|uniref:EF-hand calcium-binding domain-containing protein 3-like n=1 Tax=Trichomycterus rosablanca TaxID=2290929 RepID=UPI002F354AEA
MAVRSWRKEAHRRALVLLTQITGRKSPVPFSGSSIDAEKMQIIEQLLLHKGGHGQTRTGNVDSHSAKAKLMQSGKNKPPTRRVYFPYLTDGPRLKSTFPRGSPNKSQNPQPAKVSSQAVKSATDSKITRQPRSTRQAALCQIEPSKRINQIKPKTGEVSRRQSNVCSEQPLKTAGHLLAKHNPARRRSGSIPKMTNSQSQRSRRHMDLSSINNEDLKEFLLLLGIHHIEDLDSVVPDEPPTKAQISAFRSLFKLFAKKSNRYIHASALRSTLASVGTPISPEEAQMVLERVDHDKDGLVGFQDFLYTMTERKLFFRWVKAEVTNQADVPEKVFYKTLTKMLNDGALPCSIAEEILHYYHHKTLRLIHRTARHDDDGGHVINCKQLMKYIKPLEKHSQINSPYLQHPSLSVKKAPRTRLPRTGRIRSAKNWKIVEFEDRNRQLSDKHSGVETKEMVTPVKIKVKLALKDRDLTYDQIDQIRSESQAGLKRYLDTLTQYKRRDWWHLWGLLQNYCRQHDRRDFAQTFSTYSWSWSICREMMDVKELLQDQLSLPELPVKSVGGGKRTRHHKTVLKLRSVQRQTCTH